MKRASGWLSLLLITLRNFQSHIADNVLHSLHLARKLLYLDLTGARISTLNFLRNKPKLQVLILDSCPCLSDCDLLAIRELPDLEHLYLGFTNLSPLAIIANTPPKVHSLECSGVSFSVEEAIRLLGKFQLQYLALSFCGPQSSFLIIQRLFPTTVIKDVPVHQSEVT
jgi:hypothetical protein